MGVKISELPVTRLAASEDMLVLNHANQTCQIALALLMGSYMDGAGYITEDALSSYLSESDMSAFLSDYLSESDMSALLSDYVTESDLSDYVKGEDIGDYLSSYLSQFVTQEQIDSEGFVTRSYLSECGFVTQSYLSERGFVTESYLSEASFLDEQDLENYLGENISNYLGDYVTRSDLGLPERLCDELRPYQLPERLRDTL